MKIDDSKTRLMQVAAFLIKNHSYQFVSVQQTEHEIWLGNKDNADYPVIRLTSQQSSSLYFDRNRVLQVHSAICHVFKREARLLQICISDEIGFEADDEILIAVMQRDQSYGFAIQDVFPGIQRSLTPFDNPQLEYAMILKELELNQKSKSNQKKRLFASKWPVASLAVMGICILVFAACHLLNQFHEDQISCAIALGAYYKAFVVLNHDYWRLLTAGFVHVDVLHLVMNMLALYNMGRFCEEVFGPKKMLTILLTSIVSGSMLMHLTSRNTVGLGLSAGIYGLTGAFLIYAWSKGFFRNKSFQYQISNILFINLMMNFMPGVAASAHIGGLVCGALWGLVFCDLKIEQLQRHAIVCLLTLALFSGYKAYQEKEVDPVYPSTDMMTAEIYKSLGLDGYAENLLANTFRYYLEIEGERQ